MVHGEAILLQSIDDERGDLAVIFNYQHAHNLSDASVSKTARKEILKSIRHTGQCYEEQNHHLKSMCCHDHRRGLLKHFHIIGHNVFRLTENRITWRNTGFCLIRFVGDGRWQFGHRRA